MLALVHLSPEALADAASLATLTSMAAEHEIVMVATRPVDAGQLVRGLRAALPRRQLVALLVDGSVVNHERRLIEELLDEGSIPLVIGLDHASILAPDEWTWLKPDRTMGLPGPRSACGG
jgi:RecG-like helicase